MPHNKISQKYCWEKYGDLIEKTVEWFKIKGPRYRAKPWKQAFIEKYTRGTVLDLGAGLASTSRYYLEKKIIDKLVIMDLADAPFFRIESSSAFLIKVCGDILEVFFAANYFDTIYLFAVLHHIPGRECRIMMLKNLRNLLKKNGYLLITVWNPDPDVLVKKYRILYLDSKKDILLCDNYGCRYYHFFDTEELCSELVCAGFKIIEKGHFYQNPKQKDLTGNIYIVAGKSSEYPCNRHPQYP